MLADLFTSKKFIAAIVAVVVSIGTRFGLNLDPTTIGLIISPLLVYIGAQGLADKGKSAAEITALAQISPSEAKAAIQNK